MENLFYSGLDVHKESVTISTYSMKENRFLRSKRLEHNEASIRRYFKKLLQEGGVKAVYEAGVTGYSLYYFLESLGVDCIIISPAHISRKPSKKVKTDRIDAEELATELKDGRLTPIYIPDREDEAARDYLRAREDIRLDLLRAKKRLLAFLLRHNLRFDEAGNWSIAHRRWLKKVQFENPMLQETFLEYYGRFNYLEGSLHHMDEVIETVALSDRYREKVMHLRAFKGIDYLTALNFLVEVGDYQRFKTAENFMSYLGLTPSEYSSGPRRSQGQITKNGNKHLRRLFIESAWHYRNGHITKRLKQKRKSVPTEVIQYSDRALIRLNKKFRKLTVQEKKKAQKAAVAVARELAGFVWGLMVKQTA